MVSTEAVDTDAATPGSPTSPRAAAFLERFDKAMQLPIILAAILPIVVSVGESRTVAVAVVFLLSWAVFVVDFVVHVRLTNHYLRTGRGKFDLVIVLLTAPWFFIPGLESSRFIVVVRFARLLRVIVASRQARHLFERLGRAAIVAVSMTLACSYVVFEAEKATNPQFGNFGDAVWWGVVTITTVGYGNIVPVTPIGEWVGGVLMVTGIGLIGALAGSLASFLHVGGATGDDDASDDPSEPGDESTDPVPPVDPERIAQQIVALRGQLAVLDRQLAAMQTSTPIGGDADPGDAV